MSIENQAPDKDLFYAAPLGANIVKIYVDVDHSDAFANWLSSLLWLKQLKVTVQSPFELRFAYSPAYENRSTIVAAIKKQWIAYCDFVENNNKI